MSGQVAMLMASLRKLADTNFTGRLQVTVDFQEGGIRRVQAHELLPIERRG